LEFQLPSEISTAAGAILIEYTNDLVQPFIFCHGTVNGGENPRINGDFRFGHEVNFPIGVSCFAMRTCGDGARRVSFVPSCR
jgi:hypothetical protein